jgi:hypothetical protein
VNRGVLVLLYRCAAGVAGLTICAFINTQALTKFSFSAGVRNFAFFLIPIFRLQTLSESWTAGRANISQLGSDDSRDRQAGVTCWLRLAPHQIARNTSAASTSWPATSTASVGSPRFVCPRRKAASPNIVYASVVADAIAR